MYTCTPALYPKGITESLESSRRKARTTPPETSPYTLIITNTSSTVPKGGGSETKRKESNRSQFHRFTGRTARSGRAACTGRDTCNTGPEVLQLLQGAAAQHLPQQQEQPVDPVLAHDHRPRRVVLPARPAPRQHRAHPLLRSPVVHRPLVLGDERPDLQELLPQVVLDLEHPLAPPALHLPRDAVYPVREEVAHAVHGGPPRRRPRERRRDTLAAVAAVAAPASSGRRRDPAAAATGGGPAASRRDGELAGLGREGFRG
ncbi:hypothetical protein EUGRSUZ_I01257 [Eucalyptus grandis]|uniref:Uncharacterized protein n=2 Tax=Eucalyptus grandis TaxID=71139 RepID=A0ACC3JE57_EUCGR|nr:hypothetical protein EUGRSUZ_I01257 [Eucalyptus grandis]